MSEAVTSTGDVTSGAAGSDPQGTPGVDQPAAVPAGYVPQSEVEKAREDARRAAQAAEDLRKEVSRLKSAPAPATTEGDPGSDLDSFRQSLLRDVYGATQMSQSAASLKAEFPHADPTLFAPEKLSQFGSVDALRFAAEDSHRRVAAILDAERAAIEAKVREEMAAKFGDGGSGAAGTPQSLTGDPTPAQLAAMTTAEINELEARSPGAVDRILKATAGL